MEEKISHCLHYLLHRHRPMGSGRSIRWATEVVTLFPRQRGRPSSLRTNRALSPSLSPSRPSVRRRLSIILIGGSAEGSDGQMRARSPSLPQRQQRRSCVLLPTSSCSAARLPPSPAGPSLLSSFLPPSSLPLPCPQPMASERRLTERRRTVWLREHQGRDEGRGDLSPREERLRPGAAALHLTSLARASRSL